MKDKTKRPGSITILSIVILAIGLLVCFLNAIFEEAPGNAFEVYFPLIFYSIIGLGLMFGIKVAWFMAIVVDLVCIYQIPFYMDKHSNAASSFSLGMSLFVGCLIILFKEDSLLYFKFNLQKRKQLAFIVFAASLIAFPLFLKLGFISI